MQRYYLHGDQSEDDPRLYFCALCDVFAQEGHFKQHGEKNRARYERARARLKNINSRFTRPKNPLSLAESWPKPASPTKSSFYRWLSKQTGRDDPIGDIASDVLRDKSFPINSQAPLRLERHILLKGGHEDALTALREAFSEFRTKGKFRSGISPKLRFEIFRSCNYRCQICGRKASLDLTLEIDHKVPVARGGTNDLANLWVLCFDCNRGKSASEL